VILLVIVNTITEFFGQIATVWGINKKEFQKKKILKYQTS